MPWRRSQAAPDYFGRHVRALWATHNRLPIVHSDLRPEVRSHRPRHERRNLSLSSIPGLLVPPLVFSGLLVTLWTWKCLMMVIFQNKIIYMPSMPPFARSEKVEDYADECGNVTWRERAVKSLDDTKIYLLEGTTPMDQMTNQFEKHVIVLYFQGNGSSLPPRLPYLSSVLKTLQGSRTDVRYTIVALSYRGFWKSKGRPSQAGIELDAQAAISWVLKEYEAFPQSKVVLWGQSIGAGVATTSMATFLGSPSAFRLPADIHISGLLLETPFVSLKSMLLALYPQKFLPYRYLHPFLTSQWDSESALTKIGNILDSEHDNSATGLKEKSLRVLLLEAGEDELVPKGDAQKLLGLCQEARSIDVQHKVVSGAFHTNVLMKSSGKKEVVNFLSQFAR